jgi:hypothetical protein
MNYSSLASGHDMFTNVFVPQWAYQEFLKSGMSPDKLWKSGIPRTKDPSTNTDTIELRPDGHRSGDKGLYAVCQSQCQVRLLQCHEDHAAVEHLQFCPTRKPVPNKFGTYNQSREA